MNTSEAFITLINNKDLCERIKLSEDFRRYLKHRAEVAENVSEKTMRKYLTKAGFLLRATEIWMEPHVAQK